MIRKNEIRIKKQDKSCSIASACVGIRKKMLDLRRVPRKKTNKQDIVN